MARVTANYADHPASARIFGFGFDRVGKNSGMLSDCLIFSNKRIELP
jgi:hypothetical protein